jgi:hypothetical protein
MDFFQFLKKSKQSTDQDAENNTENKNLEEKVYKKTESKYINKKEINFSEAKDETGHVLYKNVKKGNMVRIIYNENSILNLYKGYIGEIRDYKNEQDFAIVFLHGINSQTFIKCPLQHFILL